MPPPLEQMDLDRTAVYWAPTGVPDDYGDPQFAAPVEIPVRWVQRKMESRQPDGTTVSLDAMIATDRLLTVDGKVWLGELADWNGTGSAGDADEVHRVATNAEARDIRGVNTRYEAGLQKWRDA